MTGRTDINVGGNNTPPDHRLALVLFASSCATTTILPAAVSTFLALRTTMETRMPWGSVEPWAHGPKLENEALDGGRMRSNVLSIVSL